MSVIKNDTFNVVLIEASSCTSISKPLGDFIPGIGGKNKNNNQKAYT